MMKHQWKKLHIFKILKLRRGTHRYTTNLCYIVGVFHFCRVLHCISSVESFRVFGPRSENLIAKFPPFCCLHSLIIAALSQYIDSFSSITRSPFYRHPIAAEAQFHPDYAL